MANRSTPLFLRNDTILGACEGLHQDLGINANLLRVGFAAALYFQPLVVMSLYLGLALLVNATRWFFPDQIAETAAAAPVIAPELEREEQVELPLAA